jgi:hypothetical protein
MIDSWGPDRFPRSYSGETGRAQSSGRSRGRGRVAQRWPVWQSASMPVIEILDVPLLDGEVVQVTVIAYHRETGREAPRGLVFLQAMKTKSFRTGLGVPPEETEVGRIYHQNLPQYVAALTGEVKEPIDAIFSPPSRHPQLAQPYREAIAAIHPNAVDLTAMFTRRGEALAGVGATLEQVLNGLAFDPAEQVLAGFERIVIVDESYNRGITAAGLIFRLRERGLPKDCKVIFVCPLQIEPTPAEAPPA